MLVPKERFTTRHGGAGAAAHAAAAGPAALPSATAGFDWHARFAEFLKERNVLPRAAAIRMSEAPHHNGVNFRIIFCQAAFGLSPTDPQNP